MIREANLEWRHEDTRSGLVMPWYTLPTLQWLEQQDVSNWNVFEYGAGYSTIWWKLNCLFVKSVDNNQAWAKAMGAWHVITKTPYIEEVATRNEWDCIIVDGAWRFECLQFCLPYVKKGGHLIVDNWNQEDFPETEEAEKFLQGWTKVVFKQPNHASWQTALFTKP